MLKNCLGNHFSFTEFSLPSFPTYLVMMMRPPPDHNILSVMVVVIIASVCGHQPSLCVLCPLCYLFLFPFIFSGYDFYSCLFCPFLPLLPKFHRVRSHSCHILFLHNHEIYDSHTAMPDESRERKKSSVCQELPLFPLRTFPLSLSRILLSRRQVVFLFPFSSVRHK